MGLLIDAKYELVRLLGEGGMGSVHEARHLGTGRRVALKVISADALVKTPDIVARFDREARAAGKLESMHVAQVLDSGRDGKSGQPYLVMELLRGEDLAELLTRVGALDPDVALRIVTQALSGLDSAHREGIVHRDIKPANLFLAHAGDDVTVKILDFGIAKVRADPFASGKSEDVSLTHTGSMLGSPLYMSPEQAKSAKNLDHRCDLWSLGVVLYEMLSSRTPYGDIDSLGALIVEICAGRSHDVQRSAAWVPAEIARIVHRSLHADITQRYQNASEMLADVRSAVTPRAGMNAGAVTMAMCAPVSVESRVHVAQPFNTSDGVISPFASTSGTPSAPIERRPNTSPEAFVSTAIDASSSIPANIPKRRSPAVWIAGAALALVVGGGALGGRRLLATPPVMQAPSSGSIADPIRRAEANSAPQAEHEVLPAPLVAASESAIAISHTIATHSARPSIASAQPSVSPPIATMSAAATAQPSASGFSHNRYE